MKNRIIISLFLLAAFCAAPVFAQEKSKDNIIAEYQKLKEKFVVSQEKQCEIYDNEDVAGKPISLNIDKADIRDVLKEVTKQVGVEFEIDKSVGQILINGSVGGSWNSVLSWLLASYELEAQKQCHVLRIVKIDKSLAEQKIKGTVLNRSTLFTEVIKLKNLKLNSIENKTASYGEEFEENTIRFAEIFKVFLTRRGAIEIDTRGNSLVITDKKDRAKLISDFVKHLDDSGFTLEELANEIAFKIE